MTSLINQSYPFEYLDIVIVNDGTLDGSMSFVESWRQRYPEVIRVINKENGGPASARNVGLDVVKNEWVTFPDPDDTLHPRYFDEVAKLISRDHQFRAVMVTTRLVQHVDGTTKTNHSHPLDWKFKAGNRFIDLDANPNFVHLSGGTVFLKTSIIEQNQLRFDERVRPKFEDANLIGRYLAVVDKPVVAVVASARYFYRKRSDGSSLVQSSWTNPAVYKDVPKYGYLGLIESVKDQKGYVPRWAQFMVLYELVWAFVEQKSMYSPTGSVAADLSNAFLQQFDDILSHVDTGALNDFAAVGQGWVFRNILLARVDGASEETPRVIDWGLDRDRELVKYSYMFRADMPVEKFIVNGREITPFSIKTIGHDFFGVIGVYERYFMLPYGETGIYLDGQLANISAKPGIPKRGRVLPLGTLSGAAPSKSAISPAAIGSAENVGLGLRFDIQLPPREALRKIRGNRRFKRMEERLQVLKVLQGTNLSRTAVGAAGRLGRRKIQNFLSLPDKLSTQRDKAYVLSQESADRYRKAWVLMDRKDRADDNAEHLYRYLSSARPELNIWFVLNRDSSDWDRLIADGFNLLSYGSRDAAAAILYGAYNISSHADRDIQYPMNSKLYGPSTAKIVFLQHGIIKDDLSRWLNNKSTSLMLTTTSDEYNSIVGDETNYRWGSGEIALSGLPRHDRLLQLVESRSGLRRRHILIAPTWRKYLATVFEGNSDAAMVLSEFNNSVFGANWLGLLCDQNLDEVARRHGLCIRFLAHPNLSPILATMNVPDYVEVLDYSNVSVQEELVNAAVVISDFSSLAFEGVLADSNVIHFQFDGDEIYRGGHVYRKGYFNYDTMGFGPVLDRVDDVVREIDSMASSGFRRTSHVEDRITSTFRFWDQRNCERATIAIENMSLPWRLQKPLTYKVEENTRPNDWRTEAYL